MRDKLIACLLIIVALIVAGITGTLTNLSPWSNRSATHQANLLENNATQETLRVQTVRPRTDTNYSITVSQPAEVQPYYSIDLYAETAGTILRTLDPISFTISTENGWGSNVTGTFISNDIRISIRSKQNTIIPILKYKYYDSPTVKHESLSKDDAQYYNVIRSIRFDEYICQADVVIEYDGKQEHLDARMLYEIMHRV
jgi:hypothetical protein